MAAFLKPSEVAALWGCSRQHVTSLCRAGELRAMRLGSDWRISAAAVAEYEAAQSNDAVAPIRERKAPRSERRASNVSDFVLPEGYEPVFPDLWGMEPKGKKGASR